MLFVTSTVYIIASHLIDRASAFFAAALFAVQASVLFVGRFATHDAMCLPLLALATVLGVYTNTKRWLLSALLLGLVLVLAVATKYAGLISYLPC